MTGVYVTAQACERFVERINPTLTFEQARARILASSKAIQVAADFGCTTVRTADGAKLMLDGVTVVTVIHRRSICSAQLRPIAPSLAIDLS